MSARSTDTTSTPGLRARHGSVLALVLALAIVAAVAVELVPRLQVPPDIARLRVVNPTVYQLNIDVSADADGPWLDLGTFGREGTKTIEQVGDQGRSWLFRFSSGGLDAGRLALARSDLAKAGWTVRVPDAVGERLRAKGLAPSAR